MNRRKRNSAAASDADLDRLLQMAGLAKDSGPVEPPFGFETRVVALWRAQETAKLRLTRLVRRVAVAALAVIVVSATGAYVQIEQNRESSDPFANEFAIADTAIQDEIEP